MHLPSSLVPVTLGTMTHASDKKSDFGVSCFKFFVYLKEVFIQNLKPTGTPHFNIRLTLTKEKPPYQH